MNYWKQYSAPVGMAYPSQTGFPQQVQYIPQQSVNYPYGGIYDPHKKKKKKKKKKKEEHEENLIKTTATCCTIGVVAGIVAGIYIGRHESDDNDTMNSYKL